MKIHIHNRPAVKNLIRTWSFAILFLFSSTVCLGALNSPPKCSGFLSESLNSTLPKEDVDLFELSLEGPALSGSIKASPEYLEVWSYPTRENVFPWHVYFLADMNQPVLSFPSHHLKAIQKSLTSIMGQRMRFFDVNYHLQVFFIAHDTQVFFPNFVGSGWRAPFHVKNTNAQAFSELHNSLKLKLGDTEVIYNFEEKSQIVFIGNNNGLLTKSGWSEPFTLAHEIGHTNSFDAPHEFEFLREAVADFKGLLYSGMPNSTLGPSRNPNSNLFLSLDEVFLHKENITPHDAGGFVAKGLWRTWKAIEKNNVPHYLINDYLSRIVELFTNPSSPWIENDGKHFKYIKLNTVNKKQLQKILDFFASVSMQWALERQFATQLVREIGQAWEDVGAVGPYKRYRSVDVTPSGVAHMDFLEKEHDSIDIPESWPSIDALIDYF